MYKVWILNDSQQFSGNQMFGYAAYGKSWSSTLASGRLDVKYGGIGPQQHTSDY